MLWSKFAKEVREIASLTKLMTLYTAIDIINLTSLSELTVVTVPPNFCFVQGTSANLYPGDRLMLLDLFHGLMLPSGNDAALIIANFMGGLLAKENQ